jgi:hypothetical protein
MIKKIILAISSSLLIATFAPLLFTTSAQAAESTMYLSPATGTLQNGSTVTLDIRASSTGLNAAQIDLTFSSNLEYVGFAAGADTPSTFANTAGPGYFKVTTWATPPSAPDGDILLAKITLKAIAGSGTGTVSFASTAGIYKDGPEIPTTKVSANISLTTPAPAPPSTDTSTSTSNTPTTNTNTTQPGTSNSTTAKTKNTPATVATPENPLPAATNEQIVADPNLGTSAIITINDRSGKLVKNTPVKINNKEYTTNSQGQVRYSGAFNVTTLQISIIKNGKEIKLDDFTLVRGATDQKINIKAKQNIVPIFGTFGSPIAKAVAIIAAFVAFITGLIFANRYRLNRKNMQMHGLIPGHLEPKKDIDTSPVIFGTSKPAAPSTVITPQPNATEQAIKSAAEKIIDKPK